MKRALVLAATTCAATLALAGPAAADFHPACTPTTTASASATAQAIDGGQNFRFTGSVRCDGATVEILSLNLTRRPTGEIVGSAAPASCTNCMGSISTAATVPAGPPGQYRVTMLFRTVGNGRTFNPIRTAQYTWLGSGSLSPCNRIAGQTVSQLCL